MSAEAYSILSCALAMLALFVAINQKPERVVVVLKPLQTPPSLLERKPVALPEFVRPNQN